MSSSNSSNRCLVAIPGAALALACARPCNGTTSVAQSSRMLIVCDRCCLVAALRLMEVRAAYSKTDFEWDQLQRLSVEALNKSNLQLMREAATASLQATAAATAEVAATRETAESILEQEQPATAVTAQEQQQRQQEAPEQEQQAQPANTAPAAEASSSSAECEDTSKGASNVVAADAVHGDVRLHKLHKCHAVWCVWCTLCATSAAVLSCMLVVV